MPTGLGSPGVGPSAVSTRNFSESRLMLALVLLPSPPLARRKQHQVASAPHCLWPSLKLRSGSQFLSFLAQSCLHSYHPPPAPLSLPNTPAFRPQSVRIHVYGVSVLRLLFSQELCRFIPASSPGYPDTFTRCPFPQGSWEGMESTPIPRKASLPAPFFLPELLIFPLSLWTLESLKQGLASL